MDLRGIANSVSSTVNPNVIVSLQASTGYTIGGGLRQDPSYADPVSGPAQIQALDSFTLQHVDGLNIQGDLRVFILRGNLNAVIRDKSKGGDLIRVPGPLPPALTPLIGTWLVAKVLESWPLWTKAVIVRQLSGGN